MTAYLLAAVNQFLHNLLVVAFVGWHYAVIAVVALLLALWKVPRS